MPKLTAKQARVIAHAEGRVAEAERAFEEAKALRAQVRARYAERLPLGLVVKAGGYAIKRIEKSTGRKFRLSEFLKTHKLTVAMRPFVSKPSTYEAWTVRPVE